MWCFCVVVRLHGCDISGCPQLSWHGLCEETAEKMSFLATSQQMEMRLRHEEREDFLTTAFQTNSNKLWCSNCIFQTYSRRIPSIFKTFQTYSKHVRIQTYSNSKHIPKIFQTYSKYSQHIPIIFQIFHTYSKHVPHMFQTFSEHIPTIFQIF